MTVKQRRLSYELPPEIPDDQQRLDDLHALEILDTASDRRFDRYTELLSTIFQAPIALISFVDKERQWFKSARGLAEKETSRDLPFCAHAVANNSLLVVEDTFEDQRFSRHPSVVGEPNIRFYAGAIVRGRTNKPIGACCVIDRVPRQFGSHERDALNNIARLIEQELLSNIEMQNLTKRLQNSALMDSSTGLPGLTLFSKRVESMISLATAREQGFILALIRIDRFDALEAAIGRHPASYLVRKLVERIEESGVGSSIVGQVREDKLGIAIPLDRPAIPEVVLNGLIACVEEPFILDQHTVPLRVSIGASIYPRDATKLEVLLQRARTALWAKPVTDRSEYRLYKRGQSNAAMRNFRLESALKRATEQKELYLEYQPKIDLRTQRLTGAEALLRWASPDIGMIPPSRFIPVAEESGLIVDMGEWVLSQACGELVHWRSEQHPCPEVAVNITSSQLRQADFVETVACFIQYFGLDAGQLNLELTESSLVDDIDGAVKIMRQICKLGVTFSIDDFGTGFSSLNYLRRMPIKTLKIDRSFIRNVPKTLDDMNLVRSIIDMGHSLSLSVIAEGVETLQQLEFLQAAGCDQAQGYLLSMPLTSDRFRQYLQKLPCI